MTFLPPLQRLVKGHIVLDKLKADFDYKNVISKIRINDVNNTVPLLHLFRRVVSVQKCTIHFVHRAFPLALGTRLLFTLLLVRLNNGF